MSEAHEELTAAARSASPDAINASVPDVQFRSDLAFPRLSDEMLQRIMSYGHEETVAENTQLYTYGDRDTDMFVVLSGEIESRLLVEGGRSKCFRLLSAGEFTGELNLLNTQRTVALARTTRMSRLLRISRRNLRLLMRAEGDLANIIVSACIWRRIGMMGDPSTGIVLRGKSDDPDLIKLRRFLVRNYYPHRIEDLRTAGGDARPTVITAPSVELLDGRLLVEPALCDLADELGITETKRQSRETLSWQGAERFKGLGEAGVDQHGQSTDLQYRDFRTKDRRQVPRENSASTGQVSEQCRRS